MKYTIIVKTGARRPESVEKAEDGSIIVTTRSKPIDGEANKAVISLLADHFKTAKSSINIISGAKSKIKIVEVI